jgi:hypothetical protein
MGAIAGMAMAFYLWICLYEKKLVVEVDACLRDQGCYVFVLIAACMQFA